MTLTGRSCRLYIVGGVDVAEREFTLLVSYHRRGRRLTVSPKLLARVLRD